MDHAAGNSKTLGPVLIQPCPCSAPSTGRQHGPQYVLRQAWTAANVASAIFPPAHFAPRLGYLASICCVHMHCQSHGRCAFVWTRGCHLRWPDRDAPLVLHCLPNWCSTGNYERRAPLSPTEMRYFVLFSFIKSCPWLLFSPLLATDLARSIASAFFPIRLSDLIRIQIPRPGAFLFKPVLPGQ